MGFDDILSYTMKHIHKDTYMYIYIAFTGRILQFIKLFLHKT